MSPRVTLTKLAGRHRPVSTSRFVLSGRERWMLTFRDEDVEASAEAAPLAGFGCDDLGQAEAELRSVTPRFVVDAVDAVEQAYSVFCTTTTSEGVASPVRALLGPLASYSSPSARFCVEALVLRVAALRLGLRLVDLLTRVPTASRLESSAVIDPRDPDCQEQARAHWGAGVRTFKVKCGVNHEVELGVLHALRSLDSDIRLRVDANGAWCVEETLSFLRAAPDGVEWFEDPTLDVSLWAGLRDASPTLSLAMDEPLSRLAPTYGWVSGEPWPRLSEALAGVDVLILKPMVLGGFASCLAWSNLAKQLGKRVCVSHLFDGHLALDAYIALAFAVQSQKIAAGLGRHAGLLGDDPRPIAHMKSSCFVL